MRRDEELQRIAGRSDSASSAGPLNQPTALRRASGSPAASSRALSKSGSTAALRQQSLLVVDQQAPHFVGLLVVHDKGFGAQRFEFLDLVTRFEFQLFLSSDLVARCDQQDIAVLAHVQPLGLQDDVQRLIPRDILQPQRDRSTDRVAGDDVEIGKVSDNLQQRTHVDILEVKRQAFALVALRVPWIPWRTLRADGASLVPPDVLLVARARGGRTSR